MRKIKHSFSFLIQCAKEPAEADQYIRHIKTTGRRVKVLDMDGSETFDPLAYEWSQGRDIEAAVEILDAIVSATRPVTAHTGSERFFEDGSRRTVRAAITLLDAAREPVSIATIADVIASLPSSQEQFLSEEYQRTSELCRLIKAIRFDELSEKEQHNVNIASDYLCEEWTRNDPRTTGSIGMTYLGPADPWRYEPWRSKFSGGKFSFSPKDIIDDQQVLIASFPVNVLGPNAAKMLHAMVKMVFLRAVLRRPIHPDTHIVCNVFDEAQLGFLQASGGTSRENSVLQIGRSQRLCTLYATQSVSNVAEALGENSVGPKTHALLGNFGFKAFFQNNDVETNSYASALIGKEWRDIGGQSMSSSDLNVSSHKQYVDILPATAFTRLARPDSGDPIAQAIVHWGKTFAITRTAANPSGQSHLLVEFER